MKRNISKNYNKPGKYGFCTLSSAGVLCYGADIRRCRLLLWYDVNYKSLILSIDYCLIRMYSEAVPRKNSTRTSVPSKNRTQKIV